MAKILVIFLLIFSLASCATPRAKQTQIQELQNRITTLESELSAKDEQMRTLELELEQKETKTRKETKKPILGITSKRIQIALKNAGFYKGQIDGHMGVQTKKAIKEFQKANGLTPDGMVGKRTWEKLSKYLN